MLFVETKLSEDGLPPMPGVPTEKPEDWRETGIPEEPGPVGEILTIGDLIPPEGLPIPEFRGTEENAAAEAEEEIEAEESSAPAEEAADSPATEKPPAEKEGKTNGLTRFLYILLQWTWGIIQNIAGLLVRAVVLAKHGDYKLGKYHCAVMTKWDKKGSMGLGMFIFFGHSDAPDAENVKSHEFGHTVQSAWLGPLFLPVIGIESWLWANLPSCRKKREEQGIKYCSFYPEKWANKVGEHVTGVPGPDR